MLRGHEQSSNAAAEVGESSADVSQSRTEQPMDGAPPSPPAVPAPPDRQEAERQEAADSSDAGADADRSGGARAEAGVRCNVRSRDNQTPFQIASVDRF